VLDHDLAGDGPPLLFIHAGIADRRMWETQWTSWAAGRRLIRCDLTGFGRTPIDTPTLQHAADVAALLEDLDVAGATVVGASMGGRVAMEVAVAHPDLVGALVLADAGLPAYEWSDRVRIFGAAEDEAMSRGDLDEATEVNIRMWVDGDPEHAATVDPAVRELVRRMQREALELQAPMWEDLDEELLVPSISERLGEIRVPTLVVTGDADVEDFRRIGDLLASEIPAAERAHIPGAAHLPSLERPEAFDAAVRQFLDAYR
jgi:pimeloyl-ACP methyl ester carboxylesterase